MHQREGRIAWNMLWRNNQRLNMACLCLVLDGGPYRVVFGGVLGGVSQPLITATSGLVPSSASVAVATVQRGGEAYDTHYHFEYVSQGQFVGEDGWCGWFREGGVDPGS